MIQHCSTPARDQLDVEELNPTSTEAQLPSEANAVQYLEYRADRNASKITYQLSGGSRRVAQEYSESLVRSGIKKGE